MTQLESTDSHRELKGDISGGNSLVDAGASAGAADRKLDSRSWDREFILNPIQSKLNPIDKREYAWVNFEPSWQSILVAREVGGCTKASILLKEETAFSTTKTASVHLANKAVKGGVSASAEGEVSSKKSVLIEAEFFSLNHQTE